MCYFGRDENCRAGSLVVCILDGLMHEWNNTCAQYRKVTLDELDKQTDEKMQRITK